jgi:hypothetical protein
LVRVRAGRAGPDAGGGVGLIASPGAQRYVDGDRRLRSSGDGKMLGRYHEVRVSDANHGRPEPLSPERLAQLRRPVGYKTPEENQAYDSRKHRNTSRVSAKNAG